MIRVKMSAMNEGLHDQFMRKVKRPARTAAAKSAEALADIIRVNIRTGYQMLLGDDPWSPIHPPYEKRHGRTAGQVRSEDLLNSVNVRNNGDGTFTVSVDDPKASWLEYGGFTLRNDGTWVPPRPFFRPAVHYFEQNGVANTIMIEEMESDGV
jgi:hypothetical protein